MKCQNESCKKEFEPKSNSHRYCSKKCWGKMYNQLPEVKAHHKEWCHQNYLKHKERYIESSRKWQKNNPEKAKESNKKSLYKFRTEKRERFNELMMNSYKRNRDRWDSRSRTGKIIKLKKETDIENHCEKCNSTKNLSLKFEVYPTKADEIREAITNKLIYYLCKECRYGG